MNTINRVVVVVALLGLMVLLTAVLIVPHIIFAGIGQWLMNVGMYFNSIQPVWRFVLGLLLALMVNAGLLLLIFLELRPGGRRFIRVQQVTSGNVTISTDSIVQQLIYHLTAIPRVIKVSPRVNAKGNKVRAVINVDVDAGSNVPALAVELMETVNTLLTESLGLEVYDQPEVRIKVAPSPTPAQKKPAPTPEEPLTEIPVEVQPETPDEMSSETPFEMSPVTPVAPPLPPLLTDEES